MVKLNLLVLRCRDIQASKQFYEGLGMQFVQEQHGNGPAHFAAECDGMVFELYPLKPSEAADNIRLGFQTDTVRERILVTDPDGRKVELLPVPD